MLKGQQNISYIWHPRALYRKLEAIKQVQGEPQNYEALGKRVVCKSENQFVILFNCLNLQITRIYETDEKYRMCFNWF